jgi:glycosyltransferase involved in cell wall biosynthesis
MDGSEMKRLRILLIGQQCNPENVSISLVSFNHAAALAKLHDVTLVAHSSVEAPLRRSKAPFRSIEVVRTPLLDRVFNWGLRRIFKYNYDSQALTGFRYPLSVAFEWHAWRKLRRRIRAGEFDVVLRLNPMSPALPSPFAFFLRKGPIPFVIGPLNGGLSSAPGFSQPDEKNFSLRNLYRFMPFSRSTYRCASAIILAASHMRNEFGAYSEKLFFIPENGIARSQCTVDSRKQEAGAKLQLIFVGGLVRRKACYLGVRGAASLLRTNAAHFTIIGDGPERKNLEELARSLGIEKNVDFPGWLEHAEVLRQLRTADVVVLPAIREGGGGVVFEGLANGCVPVILDYGGPRDIVHPDVGYKIPATSEDDAVTQIEKVLSELAGNRELLRRLRLQGMTYAQECLTWEAKAKSSTQVLNWVVGRGPKPDLPPSRMARVKCAVDLEDSGEASVLRDVAADV